MIPDLCFWHPDGIPGSAAHARDEFRRDGGMRKQLLSVLLVGLLPGLLSACVSFADTPGERFQRVMKEMANLCQSKKLIATESRCILPKMQPADPLATEEGRFAHSIKIPNPVPADSGYKPGMTPEQYFEHLCRTEAGEFIYKTVENVEGVYQSRPRKMSTEYELHHLYALEDLYGYTDAEASRPEGRYSSPSRYKFYETPDLAHQESESRKQYLHPSYFSVPDSNAVLARYFGYDGRNQNTMRKEYASKRQSRYGYVWRGISRPHDREMGITGGEFLVLDIETNEVLAVRRGYVRDDIEKGKEIRGITWHRPCPLMDTEGTFISKVLKPARFHSSVQGD